MSIQNIVNYYKKSDLSGDEMQKLTGKQPVLYSDLSKYKTMQELCPNNSPYQIILYQTSSMTNGHFVAIWTDSAHINFFDSYGFYPDKELQYTPYDKQLPQYLTNLIKSDGRELIYNNYDFQSRIAGISTCGRWSASRLILKHLTNAQFKMIFTGNKSPYLQDADNIITMLTLISLNDFNQYFKSK